MSTDVEAKPDIVQVKRDDLQRLISCAKECARLNEAHRCPMAATYVRNAIAAIEASISEAVAS